MHIVAHPNIPNYKLVNDTAEERRRKTCQGIPFSGFVLIFLVDML